MIISTKFLKKKIKASGIPCVPRKKKEIPKIIDTKTRTYQRFARQTARKLKFEK